MNILKTSAICVLSAICCLSASAQNIPLNEPDAVKPRLFSDVQEKMRVRITDLESLLDLPVGTSVNTVLGTDFHFQGTVVSVSAPENASVKSVVIRSTNRKGASFTFTRTTRPDGTMKYLGRIISFKNGDAFELVKENDQYILQKKTLYDLMNE